MTEHPILFSAPMVRAILDGRKTVTRRVIKANYQSIEERDDGSSWPWREDLDHAEDHWYPCPYGKPGDTLWVREATVRVEGHGYSGPVYVESDDGRVCLEWGLAPDPDDCTEVEAHELRIRPSIYMPRAYCRITLRITGLRVEKLRDISEADAMAEGIAHQRDDGFGLPDGSYHDAVDPRVSFQRLWDSLNAKRGVGWDTNPWVWVISFERVEPGLMGRIEEQE